MLVRKLRAVDQLFHPITHYGIELQLENTAAHAAAVMGLLRAQALEDYGDMIRDVQAQGVFVDSNWNVVALRKKAPHPLDMFAQMAGAGTSEFHGPADDDEALFEHLMRLYGDRPSPGARDMDPRMERLFGGYGFTPRHPRRTNPPSQMDMLTALMLVLGGIQEDAQPHSHGPQPHRDRE